MSEVLFQIFEVCTPVNCKLRCELFAHYAPFANKNWVFMQDFNHN